MARYEFSRKLSAQLNVNNVLDKTYFGMSAAMAASPTARRAARR
jgi:outer membrane receptor for ferric coprogen and ferric-rhodotorulic acid